MRKFQNPCDLKNPLCKTDLEDAMRPRAKEYRVGILKNIQPNDRRFDTWIKAGTYTLKIAEDDVIGIWASQDEGGSLLAIVHEGEIFVRW